MSTFTLQDLNLPATVEDVLNNMAIPKEVKDTSTHILHTRHVTEPQPTLGTSVPTEPTLESVINNICTQLQLLTTLITSSATKTQAENQSLQETVSLTLQQAEWFKEMVEQAVDKRDFDELVGEAVSDKVCSEVEHYFDYNFSPDDHFDFGDAVCNEVDDRLDDVVRERLDDVVQEQLEELVAEKLKNVRVVFD